MHLGRAAFLPRQEPKTPVRIPIKRETKPILEKRIREKSRRIRWAEHVTHLGKKRNTLRVLVGKPKGKNHFENSAIYERILLNESLTARMRGHRLDYSSSGQGQVTICCEYGNEAASYIKCGEFPNYLRERLLFRKNFIPRS